MVRVVHVTPDWHGFDISGGGWPSAVPQKESDVLKFFEVAIWEERRAVHFYAFDNDFDHYGTYFPTPEELTAQRESYVVMKMEGMPDRHTPGRSRFLRDAFARFTSYLARRYPDSAHHLMYNGHGGPGGRLLGGEVTYSDASALLAHWSGALGRRLGVIDMGGPCNKGSFSDLENFCQHAQYYVASDLLNGGYEIDDFTFEKFSETDPETQYHRLFAESATLEQALSGRIDIRRRRYEYSRRNMTASKTRQANYLYSCPTFAEFTVAFRQFLEEKDGPYTVRTDLYDYMVEFGAGNLLRRRFRKVLVHRADNRDFFEWGPGAHGMLMPSRPPLSRPLLTARFSAPPVVEPGVSVAFDGSGSIGAESYSWDFGDGSVIEHPSTTSSPSHSYVAGGSYRVRLEVARSGDCGEHLCEYDSATTLVVVRPSADTCEPDAETLCLQSSRFEVRVDWWTEDGKRGQGKVADAGSNDSGLFWFFNQENWEMLVKVLDGCAVNDSVWVFGASTTNVGFSMTVTDTVTDEKREYRNEPGAPANAITDSMAFRNACRR